MLVPGDRLPSFSVDACVSIEPGKEFKRISSADFSGQWLVLYSYPKDFTFICPTEITAFDKRLKEFGSFNAAVIGGSTDNEYSHLAWRESHPDLRNLKHPLAHWSPEVALRLGILHPTDGVALRVTIIVDPDGIIRYASANDLDVGRNIDEVLRVLGALQTGELCQCDWKPGQDTLSHRQKVAE